jgi:hypothetical protein
MLLERFSSAIDKPCTLVAVFLLYSYPLCYSSIMKKRMILLGIALGVTLAILGVVLYRCPCVTEVARFFGYQCTSVTK